MFGVLVEGTGDDVLARVGGETLKEGCRRRRGTEGVQGGADPIFRFLNFRIFEPIQRCRHRPPTTLRRASVTHDQSLGVFLPRAGCVGGDGLSDAQAALPPGLEYVLANQVLTKTPHQDRFHFRIEQSEKAS